MEKPESGSCCSGPMRSSDCEVSVVTQAATGSKPTVATNVCIMTRVQLKAGIQPAPEMQAYLPHTLDSVQNAGYVQPLQTLLDSFRDSVNTSRYDAA
jgi:hypothetical protein